MNDIEYIREKLKMYFRELPVDINYLSRVNGSVSLSSTGTVNAKRYVNGSSVMEKTYNLSATFPYNEDIEEQAEIYTFFRNVKSFLVENLCKGEWDDKHFPLSFELVNDGYLAQADTTLSRWVMQFKFSFREVI